MTRPASARSPSGARIVHHGDGVAWLRAAALPADHAVVTSLPDHSEVPLLGVDGWRRWFIDAAELACRQVADHSVAVFYQTDVKHDGVWIDKSYLVARGAEAAGSACLWHKVVCRAPAGATTHGRPAYAHLLCFSRSLRLAPGQSSPDVLPRLGDMPWARAMGTAAGDAVCRFLLTRTACRTVVDPFCGLGTVLAVANRHGLDAVGVELSAQRARRARALELPGGAGRPGTTAADGGTACRRSPEDGRGNASGSVPNASGCDNPRRSGA